MIHRGLKISLFILFFLVGAQALAQSDLILLNHSEVFIHRKRPPVNFPHNRHAEAELTCKDCHHQYQDGQNVLDEGRLQEGNPQIKCSACHHKSSRISLERAFHKQCISCHKKNERKMKRVGPRFCGECHLWEKKLSK